MKNILGLDLGVGSIGWSLVAYSEDNTPIKILGMGSRIVPLTTEDATQFATGQSITKNSDRTQKRTARKGYDRYQQRRENLTIELRSHGMLPDETLIKLPAMRLWQLRADAATSGIKLSLPEIGRVLYHINQRRGYKHAKSDENADKKQSDYVASINNRFSTIIERGQTIGQHFAEQLKNSEIDTPKGKFYTYRIKEQVFPRQAYVAEFDAIMATQRQFYPDVLTDNFINRLRNEIIFYQRKLKSCKHLVSVCEFERQEATDSNGNKVIVGPKVAPRTSPLFQVCKIWEMVNNIKITNRRNEEFPITLEQRRKMFDFLDSNEKIKFKDICKILNISSKSGWSAGKNLANGLQGNVTKLQLKKALGKHATDNILSFNLELEDIVDKETGEIRTIISKDFRKQPLYELWHIVYSITDKDALSKTISNRFGITDSEIIDALYKLDFIKPGYGNKSTKAMRRILPYLQQGMMYSEACLCAGFRHSESLTKDENEARELLPLLPQIQRNSLRQPIVEKILCQMVNVVNALINQYGKIDEIRVELARELKQSKDERYATDRQIRKNEKDNAQYALRIAEYKCGIRVSRSSVQKYKLWEESDHKCFYCGAGVSCCQFLNGIDAEVEHIIPQSIFFDNSFSNKVCACCSCNSKKGNKTAFDYMQMQAKEQFDAYLIRVDEAYKEGKISKTKHDRLLMPAEKIPQDFLNRDLRLTQYISRKAVEILKQICRNVYSTTGSVTDFIRRVWGYDNILHNINLERYRKGDWTERVTYEHRGIKREEERIKDWSKRLDHRHHAIDALVVAMTSQSVIQRLNKLNTERDQMFAEVNSQRAEWRSDYNLLEQWLLEKPHFSVNEVEQIVAGVAVSFKSGKKVATYSRRSVYHNGHRRTVQKGIITPRGALSEESVYGKIRVLEQKPIKYAFENPHLIFKGYIKRLVENRLQQYSGDTKKAIDSLKKNPILIHNNSTELTFATCFKDEYVIKYKLSALEKLKDIDAIVDKNIRERVEARIAQYNGNIKEALKGIDNNPVWADNAGTIPIKTVRCFTGLKNDVVKVLKRNSDGQPISYVKPGNNHHIAIYQDKDGNLQEHLVSFPTAVERVRYKVPIIIKSPAQVWENIVDKDLPQEFLSTLPDVNWTFVDSLQQNEMFIVGLSDDEYNDAIQNNDLILLTKHLYRIQKIQHRTYYFRLHNETTVDDKYAGERNEMRSKAMGKVVVIQSFEKFKEQKPRKVNVDILGNITPIL